MKYYNSLKKFLRGLLVLVPVIMYTLYSCEKEIDMTIPEKDRKLVLNGIFKVGEPVLLTVSKSKSMLEQSKVESVDNAQINLYSDNSLLAQLETSSRYWYLDYKFDNWNGNPDTIYRTYYNSGSFKTEAGKHYRLEADAPGINSKASAEFSVPTVVPILKIDTVSLYSTDPLTNSLQFTMRISDPVVENNHYIVYLKSIGTFSYIDEFGNTQTQVFENYEYIDSDDVIFSQRNGEYNIDNGLIFTDELFNGKTQDIRFKTSSYGRGDLTLNYLIILQSISEEYYDYLITSRMYDDSYNNPIAEPVSVKSNVVNGFGMVTAIAESADSSIIVTGLATHGFK
jgi:hypothetical protein